MKDGKKKALFQRIERMIRSVALTAGTLCLASVTHMAVAMPLTVPQIQTAATNTLRYECHGGSTLTVQYMNTKNKQSFALLTVDGRKMLFVNVLAGSCAKYVGDHYTWWTKGPEGSLTYDTADPNGPPMLADCKTGS